MYVQEFIPLEQDKIEKHIIKLFSDLRVKGNISNFSHFNCQHNMMTPHRSLSGKTQNLTNNLLCPDFLLSNVSKS